MMALLNGALAARLVHAAAEFKIADCLANGARDAESLARDTGTHPPSLRRLLRALAAIGILHETNDRRYALTPLGGTLRTGVPGSMRAWALLVFSDDLGRAWDALPHAVRTGENAYRHIFGVDYWTRLVSRPEAARLFDEAMQSLTQGVGGFLITHYPFGNYNWIVDVAGGNGSLLLPVLQRHPAMRGTIFDLPHVADAARAQIAAAGLADRCEAIGGDMFVSVPRGADAYVLKGVIHDWDDTKAVAILRVCRASMSDTSRLLLISRVVPERIDPQDASAPGHFIQDMQMWLNVNGSERTEQEFRDLLAQASLRLSRIVSVPGSSKVIEVDPIL
jgi:DNA-binding HxlR family transcriptional regulator